MYYTFVGINSNNKGHCPQQGPPPPTRAKTNKGHHSPPPTTRATTNKGHHHHHQQGTPPTTTNKGHLPPPPTPTLLWPRLIRRLFWTRRLRNADRAVLCAFCFVNGVAPGLVLDWSGCCVPIFGDESAPRHFAYVHEALSAGRYT